MMRLSPYSIGIYQQCPRRYRYQYVDHLIQRYRKPWPWLTMGTNIHAALTDFFSVVPVEERTADTVERLLREKWRRHREGFADTEPEREYGQRAVAQLRRFAETQKVDVKLLMIERFHEAPVADNLALMGRIDRIDRLEDGGLHVIDYKTGRVPAESDTFQLLLYALILSKTLDWPVSRASYMHLEDGDWDTYPIVDEDVSYSRDRVVAVAGDVETEEEYPENPGPLCRFCDFLEICYTGQVSVNK